MDIHKNIINDTVRNEIIINNLDLTQKQLDNYNLLLNIDAAELNQVIIKTCKVYITSLINNDKDNYLKAAADLKEFINYNIPELNKFITDSLNYTIFQLLQNKHNNLKLFYQDKPVFNIKSFKQMQADNIILKEGLSFEDVHNITEYLKKELDIYYLKYIGFIDANLLNPYRNTHYLKNPLTLKDDLKNSELIKIIYTGKDNEANNRAKLIYSNEI